MKKIMKFTLGLAVISVACSAWADVVETTNVVVSSQSTLGIRRTICNSDTKKEIAIGVPWLDFGTNSITIADLVTTGLLDDDVIKAYDYEKNIYWSWWWSEDDGCLVPDEDVTYGYSPDPAKFRVKRGTGLWLERMYPTNTFTQAGLYTTIPTTNQVLNTIGETKASPSSPVYNLLFSPYNTNFSLTNVTAGCSNNDRVYIPTTGQNYTFQEGKWGTEVEKEITILEQKIKYWKWEAATTSIAIAPNTPFWYISAGGNPKIVW